MWLINCCENMATYGITALVPPEIVYASGNSSMDINNLVPESGVVPKDKLCAWTAVWRELALMGRVPVDGLVVVSGGDCNNAVVDGERLERSGMLTHYFTYPFNGSARTMKAEISGLLEFMGNGFEKKAVKKVAALKKKALEIDALRVKGRVSSEDGFSIEVSGSDLAGDPERYAAKMKAVALRDVDYDYRIALLGTPPVYSDFHRFLGSLGLHVVFDEMPYEFIRHGGTTITGIARDYAGYTFACNIARRIDFLKKELKHRDVDGVMHFHQYACHHKLEDPILREALTMEGYPFITIEADLPSKIPQQTMLRIEAFKERLGDFI